MKYLLFMALLITGCATGEKGLLETLEFDCDEYGKIKAVGEVSVGTIPFFSSKVHVDYEKSKDFGDCANGKTN